MSLTLQRAEQFLYCCFAPDEAAAAEREEEGDGSGADRGREKGERTLKIRVLASAA